MTESETQAQIRAALGELPGVSVFRNHTGRVQDRAGRWHTFGLAVGGADLIGQVTVRVVLPATGAALDFGRFFALEVKSAAGRTRPQQALWIAAARHFGGFAAVVRSVPEALAAVERARAGASE